MKPVVMLTRRWPSVVEEELARQYQLILNEPDLSMSPSALEAALHECDAVCPTVADVLPASFFKGMKVRTRIIGNYGVGYNHIAIDAARDAGILVTNTPDVLTDATADLAITLMLMCSRRAGEGEREVRAGRWAGWRPTHLLGHSVSGKRLGLVGYGRIAQAVARRAHHGFGMEIAYYARSRAPAGAEQGVSAEFVPDLHALLAACDYVSIHVPGGALTRHLIDAAALRRMRPDAYLINSARGDIVDEEALIEALSQGRIAGAGLDVYPNEPAVDPRLAELENVVLLPHIGSATYETRIAMGRRVAANLDAFFSGSVPPDLI